jgi:hypothetical protein
MVFGDLTRRDRSRNEELIAPREERARVMSTEVLNADSLKK